MYFQIMPNFQRTIAPKRVDPHKITMTSDFRLSDGTNAIILVYSNMELQLLKASTRNFDRHF